MKVIIMGCGRVGEQVSRRLDEKGHQVSVIHDDAEVIERLGDKAAAKREADADKNLHDELNRKIREAGINAGFQNSAIRIADPARPSLKPVFPNLKLNVLLALLLVVSVWALVLAERLN